MAITRMMPFNANQQRTLLSEVGSATAVYENCHELGHMMEHFSPRASDAVAGMDAEVARCEEELAYARAHKIKVLAIHDEVNYPARLRQCTDATLILFQLGNVDLNARRIISVVGTRRCTERGRDLCNRLAEDLARLQPGTLVVSGLAYGIDIAAHRAALANGLPTVGVLAHGMDQIYPRMHRTDAVKMLEQGGLLTEFMSQTNADKPNFVRRNRIVAGMADAVILVESAAKGGGLITAEIAQSYARSVFAFPGNVGQPYSEGCNNLIRDNGAGLISSAQDFVKAMGWWEETHRQQAFADGIERNLFPDLTTEEQQVVSLLQQTNDLQLNIITVKTGIPIGRLTVLLFQLEMKGMVKPLAGGMYHLLL